MTSLQSVDWSSLPPVLTAAEAGLILRLSKNSIYEAIRCGQVPAVQIGRRLLVPRDALRRLLDSAAPVGAGND